MLEDEFETKADRRDRKRKRKINCHIHGKGMAQIYQDVILKKLRDIEKHKNKRS